MGYEKDPNRERAEQLANNGQDPGGAFSDLSAKYESQRSSAAGGKASSCFPGDSAVLTPQGWTEIRRVRPGDAVVSFCVQSGRSSPREVIANKQHLRPARLWQLQLEGKAAALRTTATHSFLTQRGWRTTRALRVGDLMQVVDERSVASTSRVQAVAPTGSWEPTFNLVTYGDNNFIVAGIVAHNFSHARWMRSMLANGLHDARKRLWAGWPGMLPVATDLTQGRWASKAEQECRRPAFPGAVRQRHAGKA